MFLQKNTYLLIFIISSVCALFFIDNGHNVTELLLKLTSILSLLGLYVSKRERINYLYVLIILFSCISSSLLIYEKNYFLEVSLLTIGTSCLAINKFLFLIICIKNSNSSRLNRYGIFLIPFLITAIIFYSQINIHLSDLSNLTVIISILYVLLACIAFGNYLTRMTVDNKYFFLGILVLILADVLILYNQFVAYNFIFVATYTSLYFVSRFFICYALIKRKAYQTNEGFLIKLKYYLKKIYSL